MSYNTFRDIVDTITVGYDFTFTFETPFVSPNLTIVCAGTNDLEVRVTPIIRFADVPAGVPEFTDTTITMDASNSRITIIQQILLGVKITQVAGTGHVLVRYWRGE